MEFRLARKEDLGAIAAMLNDDVLGQSRENLTQAAAYEAAFDAIHRDPGNFLIVGDEGGAAVAVCQLTVIPNLTFSGATRGQIEGVRVASSHRGQGLGEKLIKHAIEMARGKGCTIIQLTTNKTRADALRFYEQLGFEATHEGMKLYL